ncbi:MAG: Smr/MutS family protein [Bacteroidia bacterium]
MHRYIDLHIEKLAPDLAGQSPGVIFSYQVRQMEEFLFRSYHGGEKSVVVIHGKGERRLYGALRELCRKNHWEVELICIPPYTGGASKVYFHAHGPKP